MKNEGELKAPLVKNWFLGPHRTPRGLIWLPLLSHASTLTPSVYGIQLPLIQSPSSMKCQLLSPIQSFRLPDVDQDTGRVWWNQALI